MYEVIDVTLYKRDVYISEVRNETCIFLSHLCFKVMFFLRF